jgi:hypothetical protein
VVLTVLSALVASACVVASGRRLAFAGSPAWLDPQLLVDALREGRPGDGPKLRDAIAACEGARWEQDLVAAIEVADGDSRAALVDEQLRELHWRAQRWVRIPRVCASVATSAGFLFACIALTQGVARPTPDIGGTLVSALDALAVGMAGASFCIAVHVRARRTVRERLAATNRLVLRLEAALESTIVYPCAGRQELRPASRV